MGDKVSLTAPPLWWIAKQYDATFRIHDGLHQRKADALGARVEGAFDVSLANFDDTDRGSRIRSLSSGNHLMERFVPIGECS
jgi:hypothetical protein